jgi:hypothetical protein
MRLPTVGDAALDQDDARQAGLVFMECESLNVFRRKPLRDLRQFFCHFEFGSLNRGMRFELAQTFLESHNQNQVNKLAEA